jgi:hypothetical protein
MAGAETRYRILDAIERLQGEGPGGGGVIGVRHGFQRSDEVFRRNLL